MRIELEEGHSTWFIDTDQILRLEKILESVRLEDPLLVKIVKLRYFAGYTLKETAEILDMSLIRVNRKWAFAKALLADLLEGDQLALAR